MDKSHELNTAVLFLIFNRPGTTKLVFQAIRNAKPTRLYIAADGPRAGEEGLVTEVREIVANIDWYCEVQTLFREKNLGCKRAVSEGITWFFEHEEQGIILEDDCLPNHDFFKFCDHLLNYHKDNDTVAVITGNNFQNGIKRGSSSYYYSRYSHVWGWASWRRAWSKADMSIAFWPEWKKSDHWNNFWESPEIKDYWEIIFDRMYQSKIDTWDYPWLASLWHKGGLTITPNKNMVSNIGFGAHSTHTKSKNSRYSKLKTHSIGLIAHPDEIKRDSAADIYTFIHHFNEKRPILVDCFFSIIKRIVKILAR